MRLGTVFPVISITRCFSRFPESQELKSASPDALRLGNAGLFIGKQTLKALAGLTLIVTHASFFFFSLSLSRNPLIGLKCLIL